MYEVVRAERDTTRPYGYVEPDWRRWVPKYVPGRPWPWRSDPSGPRAETAEPTG